MPLIHIADDRSVIVPTFKETQENLGLRWFCEVNFRKIDSVYVSIPKSLDCPASMLAISLNITRLEPVCTGGN